MEDFAEIELLTLSFVCKKVVDFRDCAVESNDIDAVISGVQDQVLTHDGQANEAKISSGDIVSMLSCVGCA